MPPRKQRPVYRQKPQFASDQQSSENQQNIQQPYPNQRYQPRNAQPRYPYPQNMMGAPQMNPHLSNLEQMDPSQLESLLMQVISIYGTDLIQGGRQQRNPQYQMPGQMPYQQQQMYMRPRMQQPNYNFQRPPPPRNQPQFQKQNNQNEEDKESSDSQQNQPNQSQQPQIPQQKQPISMQGGFPQQNIPPPQYMGVGMPRQPIIQQNLCEKHFPEPIIFNIDEPLCKKCVPEYLYQTKGAPKRKLNMNQANQIALKLGLNSAALNAYSSEKNQISRSLDRINTIKKDYKYYQSEIQDREKEADQYLSELPDLMNGMFDKLEELVDNQEKIFKNDLRDIVNKQQSSIQNDIDTKVPNFTTKLSNKYNQLQQASQIAAQRSVEDQVDVFGQYIKIFNDLDAEFEKYFNEFDQIGKLQRLLDEDPNNIIKDFTEVVERNLRLDYNVKSSFVSYAPQRLHSFQWNQRQVQIYNIKNAAFTKKQVQMEFEIPLYSRSVATEDGSIYVIGGYIKQTNQYLKTCYRYDELFGQLQSQAQMQYPHADHSVCALQGFIYVVGTFVNNQVYGYCERYDTQKNKWKTIAPMKVPRSGTALCSYKNQYLLAFGGRIDQKHIVDVIEVYDIKRNVWQEIPTPLVDKSKWVPSYMGLSYQISDKEIIVFGGKSAITFQIFNGVFVFDLEKMEMKEKGSLVNPCTFMNLPLVFNHNLYAYGNDSYIHKYSIPEEKWSVIFKTI